WGKDLYAHLHQVYSRDSRFLVMFISKDYAARPWTNHERRSGQERAFREQDDYLLPVRFDDTPIPGVFETTGYVTAREYTPEELAELIVSKVLDLPDPVLVARWRALRHMLAYAGVGAAAVGATYLARLQYVSRLLTDSDV